MTPHPPPPFDEELEVALRQPQRFLAPQAGLANLAELRVARSPTVGEAIAGRPLRHVDHVVPAPTGDVVLAVFTRPEHTPGSPAIYHIHGGGLIGGNRFIGLEQVLDWAVDLDVVVVSVEYRLAPEHPYPAAIDDCTTGLRWAVEHAAELGFDPGRILLAGTSAGGGLAAALAVRARDAGGPPIAAQLLVCPMLDDRNETISSRQIDGIGVWNRGSNLIGWSAYLGDRLASGDIPADAAPGRATDLGGLPPAFIDVGSAEVFRDEAVAYASGIWAAGGAAELHVWPGGFHGFDRLVPGAELSMRARRTRDAWVRRVLVSSE